jgi:hypothetical protein
LPERNIRFVVYTFRISNVSVAGIIPVAMCALALTFEKKILKEVYTNGTVWN